MIELHREVTDLSVIIEQAIETSQPFLKERGQSLRVRIGQRCAAEVDATRVSQIIGNLLHNASKYSPAGSEIRIELERVGADAVVRVIDAGAGIPPEQIDRVFDMFARIERDLPNANGGLGIGLALARRLAQLHGGTLDVQSAGEGRGATFTLTLPGARRAAVPGASPASGGGAVAGAPVRIVVIEDAPDVGETLVMWLEGLGHEVHLATSGPDGLDLVRAVQPDLVFCDIGLPGMSGFEVCEQIRGLALKTRPVMIALTGWGTEADRRRTEAAGFDHHLVKPVAPATLQEILQALRSEGGT
jgi:two-component system CheB/CheR fusion protein